MNGDRMRSWDALEALLGAYLNEDLYLDYDDPWLAVEDFARLEPNHAPAVGAEIDALLGRTTSDSELEHCLTDLGLGYLPTVDGWADHRTWLLAVRDRVDEIVRGLPPEPATD